MAKKKKFYVVWEGNNTGIFGSWAECQLQIKGYPNAKYKSFPNKAEAEAAYHGNFNDHIGKNKKPSVAMLSEDTKALIVWDSIAVDAACSGNPGPMEYQGVDTQTGYRFFHQKFPIGTNNIGEFLALVHGLGYLKNEGRTKLPIYSDSKHAMAWVRRGKCNTKLVRNARTKPIYDLIARAEKWLATNTWENELLKWDTRNWGEIPADFGRK